MSPFLNSQAIVINRKTSRDNDLSISLLTPNFGKINTLAKGAKNIKSRRLGHLQLGNIINCQIYNHLSHYYLTESDVVLAFLNPATTLAQVNLVWFFLEVFNRIFPENQSSTQTFSLAKNIITALSRNRFHSLIKNEIALAQSLGFGLPQIITDSFSQNDLISTQKNLKKLFEEIIEQPLRSPKLFHQ